MRFLVIFLVIGGLGVGAYFYIISRSRLRPSLEPTVPKEEVGEVAPPPPPPPQQVELPAPPPPPPPPREPVDSDGDGLSDDDEAGLGSDPQKPDTDGDGLLDNEEVRIYRSDPLNPDTDGDGFSDGTEVRNGYNPTGPGRLFQVPTQ